MGFSLEVKQNCYNYSECEDELIALLRIHQSIICLSVMYRQKMNIQFVLQKVVSDLTRRPRRNTSAITISVYRASLQRKSRIGIFDSRINNPYCSPALTSVKKEGLCLKKERGYPLDGCVLECSPGENSFTLLIGLKSITKDR